MLSEKGHTQKNKYCIILFIWSKNKKNNLQWKKLEFWLLLKEGSDWEGV